MIKNINLSDDIIEGRGTNSIELLCPVYLLDELVHKEALNWDIAVICSGRYIEYKYKNSVSIYVNTYIARVVSLSFFGEYKGKFSGIAIGETVSKLYELSPNLCFDEGELYWGDNFDLSFETEIEHFNTIDEVIDKRIKTIIVRNSKYEGLGYFVDDIPDDWKKLINI